MIDGVKVDYPTIGIQVCGCINVLDWASGLVRCAYKCEGHQEYQREQPVGRAYYEGQLKCIRDGIPMCRQYIQEMEEALGPLPLYPTINRKPVALEIGCGVSMYTPWILAAGYDYCGLDPDEWACRWTGSTYNVPVVCAKFPIDNPTTVMLPAPDFDLILSAHSLEHMDDAPAALVEMHRLLMPGGSLYLLVPDDQDATNPDHKWFFTDLSLRCVLTAVGFTDVTVVPIRRTPIETFLYSKSTKP